jgi:hypothetical protein
MRPNKGADISDDFFIDDATRIVRLSEEHGTVLRLIGALAVRIHSPQFASLHRQLGRLGGTRSFSDVDFLAYSRQRGKVRELFERVMRYQPDNYIIALFGNSRLVYYHPEDLYHVDIFFDKLEFSHDIIFGSEPSSGRLELDYPTISLADMFLEKIQIHEIEEKDMKDIFVLLRAHEIGDEDEKELLNARHIAQVLANDWGFWYEARLNIGKFRVFAQNCCSRNKVSTEDYGNVLSKIDAISMYMDEEPKTGKWQKRAKHGAQKPWWRVVEELTRGT